MFFFFLFLLDGLEEEISVRRLDWDDISSPNTDDREEIDRLVQEVQPELIIAADVVRLFHPCRPNRHPLLMGGFIPVSRIIL